jgi:hypothetical protein
MFIMAGRALPQLDLTGQINGIHDAYHLAFYRAPRAGFQDRISQCLQDFITGTEPQTARWIELAVSSLVQQTAFDFVVRALHGRETVAAEFTSLDRLGVALAQHSNAIYAPERLEKTRETADLNQIGGREARKAELQGAYRFDAEGMSQKARILVVDWIMMTGTTVEAIAEAIHRELPDAEVLCFVLGKADHEGQNYHLNPEYFVSPQSGIPPYLEDEGPRKNAPGTPRSIGSSGRRPGAPPTKAPSKVSNRTVKFWSYLGASAFIFLVLGALVPLQSRKKATDPNEVPNVVPAVAVAPQVAAAPAPVAAKKVSKPRWPQGVVTVPGVGLRTKASVDARMVKNTSLKQGERVSILKRQPASAGPPWLKIQTRSGKTGWVFASVIKERSSK